MVHLDQRLPKRKKMSMVSQVVPVNVVMAEIRKSLRRNL
jgi:hypothetical protein